MAKEYGKKGPRYCNTHEWVFKDGLWYNNTLLAQARDDAARNRTGISPWQGYLVELRFRAWQRVETAYPAAEPRRLWDRREHYAKIYAAAANEDEQFVRFWVDQFIEWVGYELWNGAYNQVRLGAKDQVAGMRGDEEVAAWEAHFQ